MPYCLDRSAYFTYIGYIQIIYRFCIAKIFEMRLIYSIFALIAGLIAVSSAALDGITYCHSNYYTLT